MPQRRTVLQRRDVIAGLLGDTCDTLVVTGLGDAANDVAALTDQGANVFAMDGVMGAAVSVGLGLALAQPQRRVLVVTGDGELLMNVGALATVAVQRPANLGVLCLDNGSYELTGGQATHTAHGTDTRQDGRGRGPQSRSHRPRPGRLPRAATCCATTPLPARGRQGQGRCRPQHPHRARRVLQPHPLPQGATQQLLDIWSQHPPSGAGGGNREDGCEAAPNLVHRPRRDGPAHGQAPQPGLGHRARAVSTSARSSSTWPRASARSPRTSTTPSTTQTSSSPWSPADVHVDGLTQRPRGRRLRCPALRRLQHHLPPDHRSRRRTP